MLLLAWQKNVNMEIRLYQRLVRLSAALILGSIFLYGCGGGDSGIDTQAESFTQELSDGSRGNTNDAAPSGDNNSPSIDGDPADKIKVGEKYEFRPVYGDQDGDTLSFAIRNRPVWLNFDSNTGRVFGRPAAGDIGLYSDIEISVFDGSSTVVLRQFNVRVTPEGNNLPTINGKPAPSVTAGKFYSFRPNADDPDGDVLGFEISGKPSWANFDIETGRLYGKPQSSDVGSYGGVKITVSDGQNLVGLPTFSINVERVLTGNQPPSLSGSPVRQISVGQFYDFAPTASDIDAGSLTFSISNKPDWANFNPATGRLSGTPAAKDVGTKWGIQISVSDGIDTASLDPFGIRVDKTADVVTKKYNPGHYITVYRTDTGANITNALYPGVTGVQKRFFWRSLEGNPGQYKFAQLKRDLDRVHSRGARMMIVVEDKSFENSIPTPAYMRSYTFRNITGGYTVKRWDPYVVKRFAALVDALGKEFDDHPAFEGIGFQETSLSLDEKILNAQGYSPQKYRDALIDILNAASADFPRSQVFWFQNFLKGRQEYIDQIIRAVAPKGVAIGGPDILPDAWDLKSVVYPRYDQYKNKIPLFNSVQYDSYAHLHKDKSYPTKYWTPQELFVFGRDRLHLNYIFWHKKRFVDKGDEGSYTLSDALPVIKNNPVINR